MKSKDYCYIHLSHHSINHEKPSHHFFCSPQDSHQALTICFSLIVNVYFVEEPEPLDHLMNWSKEIAEGAM